MKAAYLIANEKKLIEKDGVLYLLPMGSELNEQNKAKARQAFLDSRILRTRAADYKKTEYSNWEEEEEDELEALEKIMDKSTRLLSKIRAISATVDALLEKNPERAEDLLNAAPKGQSIARTLDNVRKEFVEIINSFSPQNFARFTEILAKNFPFSRKIATGLTATMRNKYDVFDRREAAEEAMQETKASPEPKHPK